MIAAKSIFDNLNDFIEVTHNFFKNIEHFIGLVPKYVTYSIEKVTDYFADFPPELLYIILLGTFGGLAIKATHWGD